VTLKLAAPLAEAVFVLGDHIVSAALACQEQVIDGMAPWIAV
jgi:hypothetical protein